MTTHCGRKCILRCSTIQAIAMCLVFASRFGVVAVAEEAGSPRALRPAHAHNDYYHERPLLDALDRGFPSVEADVFLVDGELLVGHELHELDPDRTLRALYLDPLFTRVQARGGHVHEQGSRFYLFVDIKDDADRTRKAIGKLLQEYASMVGSPNNRDAPPAAVTVVLSGSEPRRGIVIGGVRLAGADGRLSDLESKATSAAMPVISDHWGQHFDWQGVDTLPEEERQRLLDVTRKAHKAGRLVRFWATKDSEHLWDTLLDHNVDLINTDDLDRLAEYVDTRKN